MTDKEILIKALQSYSGGPVPPGVFMDLLDVSMDMLDVDESNIATAAGVSRSTVRRWRNGESSPHMGTRRRCIRLLARRLSKVTND